MIVETTEKFSPPKGLKIKDKAPYVTVVKLDTGPVEKGTEITVFGQSHGDPRQTKKQKECAWVTGIYVYDDEGGLVAKPCPLRGRDLLRAKKDVDDRAWPFTVDRDYANLQVRYLMRAINKKAGGAFRVSWAKLAVKIGAPDYSAVPVEAAP